MSAVCCHKPVPGRRLLSGIIICWLLAAAPGSLPAGDGAIRPEFDFTLAAPGTSSEKEYLGLLTDRPFYPGEIRAEIIMIQVFSMYCPVCQREAGNVNRLFTLVENSGSPGRQVKMIGIGAGNSAFETAFFKSRYRIGFPLFSDPDFSIHKRLGSVGTPHFFGLKVLPDHRVDLFFSHSGGIPDPGKFWQTFLRASGRVPLDSEVEN